MIIPIFSPEEGPPEGATRFWPVDGTGFQRLSTTADRGRVLELAGSGPFDISDPGFVNALTNLYVPDVLYRDGTPPEPTVGMIMLGDNQPLGLSFVL